MYKRWGSEEILLLKETYPNPSIPVKELIQKLGRTRESIEQKARKIGLYRRMNREPDLSMNEDLAYVLGVLKGDGCVGKYKRRGRRNSYDYMIQLNTADETFALSFARALQRIGIKSHIDKNRWFHVEARSRKFVEWYRSLFIDDIERLLDNDRNAIRGFIRGFYESEGIAYVRNKRMKKAAYTETDIHMYNTDLSLVLLVQRLLLKLGFKFSIRAAMNHNPPYYILSSYSNERAKSFFAEINPCIKLPRR